MKISLFVVAGMPDNIAAFNAINKLPGAEIEQVPCPSSMQQWYVYPYIKDQDGVSYFGLEDIVLYAETVKKS